ncbi:MAG: hypothetical protein ABH834_04885 [Candidatus Altiarchaeota archaeon]
MEKQARRVGGNYKPNGMMERLAAHYQSEYPKVDYMRLNMSIIPPLFALSCLSPEGHAPESQRLVKTAEERGEFFREYQDFIGENLDTYRGNIPSGLEEILGVGELTDDLAADALMVANMGRASGMLQISGDDMVGTDHHVLGFLLENREKTGLVLTAFQVASVFACTFPEGVRNRKRGIYMDRLDEHM